MCGITGFISNGGQVSGNKYYKAHLTTAHRGPDDEGFFYIKGDRSVYSKGDDTSPDFEELPHITESGALDLILGHRRLSIIDLSSAGHQPFNLDEHIVVYNGEIYNYLELKKELEELGVSFNTSTDTEVFLAAFIFWGDEAFKKFNGMWAAVIYNSRTKETTFTRDRFGVKPFYYLLDEEGVYFSSEIKFFRELKDLSEIDEEAVYQYLRYSETDFSENTMFKKVKQLQPGFCATVSNGQVNKKEYWGDSDLTSLNKSLNSVESVLKSSIDIRLRSDVTVGSLLSGGIDSSLIVGMINDSHGLSKFNSYSAVFEEEKYSEKKYIEKTAELLNFSPKYIYPKADDLTKYVNELIYIQELPFRSLSVLSQYLIYKDVAETGDVKVLLNGQGADEIFSGYTEHYFSYFVDLFKRFKFFALAKEFIAFKEYKSLSWKTSVSVTVKSLLTKQFERTDKYGIFNRKFKRNRSNKPFRSELKNKLYSNLNFSALREYLRYEDRNSMRFSLESRLPFLDFRLVQSAFSLSPDDYIVNGVTKVQLREIGKSKLAEEVRLRRDKTGFVSPQELWQKNELKLELDNCFDVIQKEGLFDFIEKDAVVSLYQEYKKGISNDWAVIWRIYCLYKWKKIWIEKVEVGL